MTEHTPGPWLLNGPHRDGGNAYRHYEISADAADGYWIAEVQTGDAAPGLAGEANARLIAAAPDLLAALEEIVLEHDTQAAEDRRDAGMAPPYIGPCTCGNCDAARAAITKARGEGVLA